MASNRPILIAFVLAALFIVVCRLPGLARPIWSVDEGSTAITANVLLNGGAPYKDSVDHRGPVTYFVYALVFALAGKNNMFALHLALIGVVVGLLGLLAILAQRIMSTRGTVFSLVYFAVASTFAFWPHDLMAFHTEWIVIVFTSLGTLLCWSALDRPAPLALGILSGMSYGLACFTKQPAALDVLATLTFLGIMAWARAAAGEGPSRRQILTLSLGIALGGLIAAAIVCGFFLLRGAWSEFVFYVWTYNSSYYMKAQPLTSKACQLMKVYDNLTAPMGLAVMAAGGLLSLTSAAGWLRVRTGKTWRQFHVALLGISSLFAGLVGTRDFPHYFIMLLPSWCLLAGLAFDALAPALKVALPDQLSSARKRGRILIMSVIAAPFLIGSVLRPLEVAWLYGSAIRNWVRIESNDPLITYIKRECPSEEKIVIWGFKSDLYILTNRDPATRFSYTTFLVGLIPGVKHKTREAASRWAVPGAMETFLDEIRSNRPLFIIDASRSSGFGFDLFPLDEIPQIAGILAESYELVPELSQNTTDDKGCRVYRRRDWGRR